MVEKESVSKKIARLRRKAAIVAALSNPETNLDMSYPEKIKKLLELEPSHSPHSPNVQVRRGFELSENGQSTSDIGQELVFVRSGGELILIGTLEKPLTQAIVFDYSYRSRNPLGFLDLALREAYERRHKYYFLEGTSLVAALSHLEDKTAINLVEIKKILKEPLLKGKEDEVIRGMEKIIEILYSTACEKSVEMCSDLHQLMEISKIDSIRTPDNWDVFLKYTKVPYGGFMGIPVNLPVKLLHAKPQNHPAQTSENFYLVELPPFELEGKKRKGTWELRAESLCALLSNYDYVIEKIEDTLSERIKAYEGAAISELT